MKKLSKLQLEQTVGVSTASCFVDAFLGHGPASLILWGACLISAPATILLTGTMCYVKNQK
jgi:hypothetical protein